MKLLGRLALAGIAAAALAACGGDDGTPDTASDRLTITNETPCVIRVRFDNGVGVLRMLPGETAEYEDEMLADYGYLQVESTMAVFRNFDMRQIRDDGYRLTVRPALEDNACVEEP